MKVTINGFIFARPAHDGSLNFEFSNYDVTKYDNQAAKVREHSIDFDVPDDFDPRPGIVENLEREKTNIRAEAEVRVTDIDRMIQTLLAIDNAPTARTPA
ncbi:hypothetical protein [Burkholderia glumae]|uniref:hypothetical protein n=1 Tax=Burkholderia glumae TaxID=337 RepID=UPI001AE9AF01|nr:hypothetical protein [Burkholderia glumae]QTP32576.1 hypothetical protein B7759_01149 [Burkholderia glumae]